MASKAQMERVIESLQTRLDAEVARCDDLLEKLRVTQQQLEQARDRGGRDDGWALWYDSMKYRNEVSNTIGKNCEDTFL